MFAVEHGYITLVVTTIPSSFPRLCHYRMLHIIICYCNINVRGVICKARTAKLSWAKLFRSSCSVFGFIFVFPSFLFLILVFSVFDNQSWYIFFLFSYCFQQTRSKQNLTISIELLFKHHRRIWPFRTIWSRLELQQLNITFTFLLTLCFHSIYIVGINKLRKRKDLLLIVDLVHLLMVIQPVSRTKI